MRGSVRLAVAALTGLAALAVAVPARATYKPVLAVDAFGSKPSKPTAVVLTVVQDRAEDATARIDIYAPVGYRASLGQAVGTKLGDVHGLVLVGETPTYVTGALLVDNPAAHAADPCAPGLHQAVWNLSIVVAGVPTAIPVYVDPVASGPEAGFASFKLQLCLTGAVGTPGASQLLDADFDVDGVFVNPPARGANLWRATFMPYLAGANPPQPNPAGVVEAQAFTPNAVALSLTVKSRKGGWVTISGRALVLGAPFGGLDVEVYAGHNKAGHMTTNRRGRFTFRTLIRRKTSYKASGSFFGNRAGGCTNPLPPALAPGGCVNATISFFVISNSAMARFRR